MFGDDARAVREIMPQSFLFYTNRADLGSGAEAGTVCPALFALYCLPCTVCPVLFALYCLRQLLGYTWGMYAAMEVPGFNEYAQTLGPCGQWGLDLSCWWASRDLQQLRTREYYHLSKMRSEEKVLSEG